MPPEQRQVLQVRAQREAKPAEPKAAPFSGAIEFLGPVQGSLHLVCGWVLGEGEVEAELVWRSGRASHRGTPIDGLWTARPDLPDFLETGRKAGFKRGFFGLFSVPPNHKEISILVGARGVARARTALSAPAAQSFQNFFAGAKPEVQFEIAHLFGSVGLTGEEADAPAYPDLGEWLDDLPYLEGAGQAHGLSFGFDTRLIGDDGQIFIEGWMKNAGAARAPSLRVVVTETALLRYQWIDQATLRPDIAAPGAGGLRRPGFFIIGQSQPVASANPPSIVIEIQHGGARHWLRLAPQQVSHAQWRNAFIDSVSDRSRIEPQAHRALLSFFSRPALPCPHPPAPAQGAPAQGAPAIAAICIVDFLSDNPCRGLIVASLARLARPGLKLITISDDAAGRAALAWGVPRTKAGSGSVTGLTLAEGLAAAQLEPDQNILFLSCATLLRSDPVAAFAEVAPSASPLATHWLITPQGVGTEPLRALQSLLAWPKTLDEDGSAVDASEAYLDVFIPFVAPCAAVLGLARHWTPPLPALLYREVIRQAAARCSLGVISLDSLSSYRQQDEAEARFLRLYRELLP